MTVVTWPGFYNARDLGGLPLNGGGTTRAHALVRSADTRFATPEGWSQAVQWGLRTVVDLRPVSEAALLQNRALPPGVRVSRVALPNPPDGGTPLFFADYLVAHAEPLAAAVRAIALAVPGGVLVHCTAGRDRTGLLAMVVLSLVGVLPGAISDDYELSAGLLASFYRRLGKEDPGPENSARLARLGTSAREIIDALHKRWELVETLSQAGLTPRELAALRRRMAPVPEPADSPL